MKLVGLLKVFCMHKMQELLLSGDSLKHSTWVIQLVFRRGPRAIHLTFIEKKRLNCFLKNLKFVF